MRKKFQNKKSFAISRLIMYIAVVSKLNLLSWTHTLACFGKTWVYCGDDAIKGFEEQGKLICFSIYKSNFSKWEILYHKVWGQKFGPKSLIPVVKISQLNENFIHHWFRAPVKSVLRWQKIPCLGMIPNSG